ncbi:hypothetical protein EJB05_06009 [Eragrostis curvula]|uniref:MBD domain-containing protein n=1 Tax=Eragrostis curvula TaxID=38414 RepID=A0A5J9WDQ7_9POAL|nr:hypothetical protein EJB05_06009 [Eragrostis curvula]
MSDKAMVVVSDDAGVKEPLLLKDGENVDDRETTDDLPDWLPDGWIMESFRTDDGTINQYYTSPISDYTFTSKAEVLEYLFSGVDERIQESKECAEMTLQKTHEWLPKGWVMEIRVGGQNRDKMYKFYVLPRNGVRLLSKEDVLLYLKQAKISMCDTNGQCDSSSNDNIIAKVELHPNGLPSGWVKELVFRKTKEGSVRRDPYYTDPTRGYTFRTLKLALGYLESGKVPKRAFTQKTSVHDIYSFEKCADLHDSLRSRLAVNMKRHCKRTGPLLPENSSGIDYDGDTDSSRHGHNASTEWNIVSAMG